MIFESWGGRILFFLCGIALFFMGGWGVLHPTLVPLNIVDPNASPTLDIVNQICTVAICLSFIAVGTLFVYTVGYSVHKGMHTVDDTPKDPLTPKRVILHVLFALAILLAMLIGAYICDYFIQRSLKGGT